MNRFYIFFICLLLFGCTAKPKLDLTAEDILLKAYDVAGGDFWKRPESLVLKGYGIFYKADSIYKHEKHHMWRVYESSKDEAHAANGKVRIESIHNGEPVILISFDGKHTYDHRGRQPESEADKRWASNFGYGVIRHALDSGYQVQRLSQDTLRGQPIYQVKVIDPNAGETIFGIEKNTFNIVKVGFDTPRGWHERIYSDFFRKDEYAWNQSGRVELFYNGMLSNEIIWEDFDVNVVIPDSLFIL